MPRYDAYVLTSQSDVRLGESRLKNAIFLERRFRLYTVWRDRLLFDTKLMPPAVRSTGASTLLFVASGSLQIGEGPVLAAPAAFSLAESEYERVRPGAINLRTWGEPLVAVDLRFATGDVRVPIGLANGPLALPASLWSAVDTFVERLVVDGPQVDQVRALVAALEQDSIVAPGLADSIQDEPENLRRLWSALEPLFNRQATTASLLAIKRELGLSIRQLHRDATELARTFGLLGDGFRSTLKLFRMRAAVAWLATPDATLQEVAEHVGYRTVDAMARAFRDTKLPPPSAVRDIVRFPG
jgi:AraC-like DNA-binding protein